MGYHIDGVKFAGGSFSLFPEDRLREMIDLCHTNNAYVSTVSSHNKAFTFGRRLLNFK